MNHKQRLDELVKLRAAADSMAEALGFYADKNKTTGDLYFDGGTTAREAITQYNKLKGE